MSDAPGGGTWQRRALGEAAWVATWAMLAITITVLFGDPGDVYVAPDEDQAIEFSLPAFAGELLLSLCLARWLWRGAALLARRDPRLGRALGVLTLGAAAAGLILLAHRSGLHEVLLWHRQGFPPWAAARYPGRQRAVVELLLVAGLLVPLAVSGAAILRRPTPA